MITKFDKHLLIHNRDDSLCLSIEGLVTYVRGVGGRSLSPCGHFCVDPEKGGKCCRCSFVLYTKSKLCRLCKGTTAW